MDIASFGQKLPHIVALTRLNRPIGIYLLMWPMLWALWFAAKGVPDLDVLLIFMLGTVLTRSAGCAINDFADRHIDGSVGRTRHRPLASGALTPGDALVVAGGMMLLAFVLVLLTNRLTIQLSFIAVLLACVYPFCKRFTHLPQIVLGAAFGFAIPMAFAAQTNSVPPQAWALFFAALLWAVAYDTLYAMADRDDDLKVGVKSTAILLGSFDLLTVGIVQLSVLAILTLVGWNSGRGFFFFTSLAIALLLVAFQLWISRKRDPDQCVRAFLNNHWLGMAIFIGLALDFALNP